MANWITLGRVPILLINILVLYRGSPALRLAGVGLLFIGLMLDTVDGMVARARGETSLFGSVLDIAIDRLYESALWLCFANLGFISVAIPLIVIARTTLTDAFRSIAVAQGTAPFAIHRTALGRFLVGSTWMRVGYSVAKTLAFCGLALAQALADFPALVGGSVVGSMVEWLQIVAWIAVIVCVGRGAPVIMHSVRAIGSLSPSARYGPPRPEFSSASRSNDP